ncbi:MAG: hypothetical protein ABR501_07895 [Pyrinomonadaceae bacterium]
MSEGLDVLHIHNGDCSANIAKQSSLPGEHFAWREALVGGPTPAGLDGASWRSIRAQHLAECYGLDSKECERELLAQEKKLASFKEHDEAVLWFEHDLFCQIHLAYILDWFSQRDTGKTTVSLICVGKFPGRRNFRGLGELTADELASLFPDRNSVSATQLQIASTAWKAYCFPDPTKIERLMRTDTSSLPFLAPALNAHLRRFPSTRNGLGAIENRGLEIIHGGVKNFVDVFSQFGRSEPAYGLGDAQFWDALQRLTTAKEPLLTTADGNGASDELTTSSQLTPAKASKTSFELTKTGESVLKGETDFVALNGIDLWLGGVHLHDPANLWRWNEQSKTIIP